jgi:hypothetical protein
MRSTIVAGKRTCWEMHDADAHQRAGIGARAQLRRKGRDDVEIEAAQRRSLS